MLWVCISNITSNDTPLINNRSWPWHSWLQRLMHNIHLS
jgi:hypothetical protein